MRNRNQTSSPLNRYGTEENLRRALKRLATGSVARRDSSSSDRAVAGPDVAGAPAQEARKTAKRAELGHSLLLTGLSSS